MTKKGGIPISSGTYRQGLGGVNHAGHKVLHLALEHVDKIDEVRMYWKGKVLIRTY